MSYGHWVCVHNVIIRASTASSDKFGFALLHCINLIGMCQWGTRDATEIENEMTSVERIIEYTKIESEPPLKVPSDHLPKHWPSSGGIVFKNVEFKYSNSRAVVLKDLSFRINPGEKIGIIGHTGKVQSIHLVRALAFKSCNIRSWKNINNRSHLSNARVQRRNNH